MALQDTQVLIPGIYEYLTLCGKRAFADVINELELGQLSWIIWLDPKQNHKYPCKRGAGDSTTDKREDSHVMKAEKSRVREKMLHHWF